MKGVEFIRVSEFNKKATEKVAQVERTGRSIVIIRHSKPAAVLEQVQAGVQKGKHLSVTDLKNDTNAIIAEIEEKGTRHIITRFSEPVAVLRKLSAREFSL